MIQISHRDQVLQAGPCWLERGDWKLFLAPKLLKTDSPTGAWFHLHWNRRRFRRRNRRRRRLRGKQGCAAGQCRGFLVAKLLLAEEIKAWGTRNSLYHVGSTEFHRVSYLCFCNQDESRSLLKPSNWTCNISTLVSNWEGLGWARNQKARWNRPGVTTKNANTGNGHSYYTSSTAQGGGGSFRIGYL